MPRDGFKSEQGGRCEVMSAIKAKQEFANTLGDVKNNDTWGDWKKDKSEVIAIKAIGEMRVVIDALDLEPLNAPPLDAQIKELEANGQSVIISPEYLNVLLKLLVKGEYRRVELIVNKDKPLIVKTKEFVYVIAPCMRE